MAEWQRTHTCGELRESHVGQTVTLNGWVNTARVYPDQVFLDLRDRYGLTQVVIEADRKDVFTQATQAKSEWVLSITGIVRPRQEGKHNLKIATGHVEVDVTQLRVLNQCPTPPFEVHTIPQKDGSLGDPELANEDLRLQNRYLDLRRASLHRTLTMRHRLCKIIRDYLDARNFLELETPLLGRSTPEGARDYLVPSRVHEGQWYALPQSPQIYKQLLMVAGYDRYFQIARCLRDEDLRADRQPEFTQLDLEMSFVEMDDVFAVIEGLTAEVFGHCLGVTIPLPLPRIKYEDAILRYGSDKPDLRYGLEIVELSEIAGKMELAPFRESLAVGGKVRGINAKGGAAKFSRKNLDDLGKTVTQSCGKMLAYIKVEDAGKVSSSISKFLTPEVQAELVTKLEGTPGDLLLLGCAETEDDICQAMGVVRQQAAQRLELVEQAKERFKIAWVLDFPSFIRDEEENRWAANHHPFTAPRDEDLHLMETEPGKVRAKAYDLVINGYECGGGSIRIHNPDVQARLFRVLGMTDEQAKYRFGFLLDALKYGAPPHGGIALGIDRWAMMLAGTTNIRDVIAFPKNQKARDLMTGAPASVDAKQLRELGMS
jgi:aspartyl-tRNA synthetase